MIAYLSTILTIWLTALALAALIGFIGAALIGPLPHEGE